MAQHYTPIWDDWPTVTRELNDQEKGRLIDAVVAYDNGGDWQDRIKGNERYVFPGYQARIDRYKAANAGKTKDKDTEETENSEISKKTENIKKNKNSEIYKVKDKVKVIDCNSDNGGDAREDDLFTVDIDPLIVKVQRELNGLTDTHYQALNDYRDELSDEVVSHAIDTAVANGTRNWAYVETILRSYTKEHITTLGEAKAADERHRSKRTTVQTGRSGAKPAVNPWADAVLRGDYDE